MVQHTLLFGVAIDAKVVIFNAKKGKPSWLFITLGATN